MCNGLENKNIWMGKLSSFLVKTGMSLLLIIDKMNKDKTLRSRLQFDISTRKTMLGHQ